MQLSAGASTIRATEKKFRGGTHRAVPPRETMARVQPLLAKAGITRIADVTGLDRIGIPVIMVCRPNSRSLSVSQGKGLTTETARVSGVMESLELFHAEQILSPLKLATYDDLRTNHRVVDVRRLPSVKNSRFHPHLQILWIEGRDIRDSRTSWIPYECVHASASSPAPTGSGCFSSTSNGLASGNHMLEAVLHGVCELIERDAVTLWGLLSRENRELTRLDLESIDDVSSRFVIDRCVKAGNMVAVWDVTSDVGLPVFLCRIVERENHSFYSTRSFSGMGCHTTREIALLRALTEAVQSRLTYISGSRDDLYRHEYESTPDTDAALRAYLVSGTSTRLRNFQDVPTFNHDSFEEDISAVLARLSAAGAESVIAVDLSRPDFDLPVVRMVVPGLEGPDGEPEYVPGDRSRAISRDS